MKRGPDIGRALTTALAASAAQAGCAIHHGDARWSRWASATFQGARHQLTLSSVADGRFDTWVGTLNDADLPISGHIVADVQVIGLRRVGGNVEADIEALTVEAA
ncbi:MAG: hypothetical protein ACKVOB_02025 [Sphingomonas sp.]